jgi:hypothetical protein
LEQVTIPSIVLSVPAAMVTEACEDVTHHLMHLQKGFILDPKKKDEEATQIGLLISYCKQAADSSTQSTLTGQWDL